MKIEWSGWQLEGRELEAPRKVRLSPGEASVLRTLIAAKGQPVSLETIKSLAAMKSKVSTVRSVVNTLRAAVGQEFVLARRNVGYRVVSVRPGRGPSPDPIDDLIKKLRASLSAAIALKRTRL